MLAPLLPHGHHCSSRERLVITLCTPRLAHVVRHILPSPPSSSQNTGVEGGETAIKLARRWGYDVKGVEEVRLPWILTVWGASFVFLRERIGAGRERMGQEGREGVGRLAPYVLNDAFRGHCPFAGASIFVRLLRGRGVAIKHKRLRTPAASTVHRLCLAPTNRRRFRFFKER